MPPIVHEVLRSPGKTLDPATRAFMEPRFGHDFSQVRVHTDAKAAESARAANALAFTVGRNLVFDSDRYRPGTSEGRRLLAHELTHYLQQGGDPAPRTTLTMGPVADPFEREADSIAANVSQAERVSGVQPVETGSSPSTVQRDLATPPPVAPSPAQPALNAAQIQEAIAFNRARYNEANTRLIQILLGGPVTGTWTADNIEAIAATQEQYGLHKDGKVGDDTFRFLDREERLENLPTNTDNCLVSFRLIGPDTENHGRDDPTHCHFGNHFAVEAQFSPRCNCSQFEYRQFIRGHLRRTRGGVVTDLPITEPGGVLPAAFIEDTDTTAAVPHYGHRADPAEGNPEDHYMNAASVNDQAHGCRFRMQDFPGNTSLGDCLPGDRYDLRMGFRGEIQRNGSPIQQKLWTAVNLVNWQP